MPAGSKKNRPGLATKAAGRKEPKQTPFTRVFIANRGEIACRLIDACRALSLSPILGYSVADSTSRAARLAPESICIGAADARESYLNMEKVIAAALDAKAEAIHPGYGFLSENAEFVAELARNGLRFIGPSASAMKMLGDKVQAKELARKNRIPLLEDISFTEQDLDSPDTIRRLSRYLKNVSFPLLVKSAGGGGGRGMRVVESRDQLEAQMRAASREAKNLFNDATIFIEPYIIGARHVEVQVVADSSGDTRAVGTRDCSLQRRHQKVIEEAPASQLSPTLQKKLHLAAEKICRAASYESLATVEFLVTSKGTFFFLEVNTRLQVEHPVTELACGLDLVSLQIQIAQGEKLTRLLPRRLAQTGHSIEARICAESPELDFRTSVGPLVIAQYPVSTDVRVDYGFEGGDRITHYYDSLIAKIIVRGKTRAEAVSRLEGALAETVIAPPRTNLGYLRALVSDDTFRKNRHTLLTAGEVLTEFSNGHHSRLTLALLAAGLFKSDPICKSPWSAEGSWSIGGTVSSRIDIKVNGSFYQVTLSRVAAGWKASVSQDGACRLEETGLDFVRGPNGAWKLSGLEYPGSGICHLLNADICVLECQGDYFAAEYTSPRSRVVSSAAKAAGRAELRAHLPGKIVSLSATTGKIVDEGSTLLVLESMKMEHILTAPVRGKVGELLVTTGQSVAAGDLLAVIIAGA